MSSAAPPIIMIIVTGASTVVTIGRKGVVGCADSWGATVVS